MYYLLIVTALIHGGDWFRLDEELVKDSNAVYGVMVPSMSREYVAQFRSYEPRVGDIILFLSPHVPTRAVFVAATGSHITHVAAVIHDENSNVCILDADKKTGVQLTPATLYVRSFLACG